MSDDKDARIAELQADNARLRDALERVARNRRCIFSCPEAAHAARAALESKP